MRPKLRFNQRGNSPMNCACKTSAIIYVAIALLIQASQSLRASELSIAVATNFVHAMHELSERYVADTPQDSIRVSSGSTGKLFAQIKQGMKHDLFFAADTTSVTKLVEENLAVRGSTTIYAIGVLVVWTPGLAADNSPLNLLRNSSLHKFAIANPKLAPYGAAAIQTLQSLELEGVLKHKLVMGENVGQTYALIHSGNAQAGIVAMSSLHRTKDTENHEIWKVPKHLHAPINQMAAILTYSDKRDSAQHFLNFVTSEIGRSIIKNCGYGLP